MHATYSVSYNDLYDKYVVKTGFYCSFKACLRQHCRYMLLTFYVHVLFWFTCFILCVFFIFFFIYSISALVANKGLISSLLRYSTWVAFWYLLSTILTDFVCNDVVRSRTNQPLLSATAPVFLWPPLSCRHQSRPFSSSSDLHSGSSQRLATQNWKTEANLVENGWGRSAPA